MKKHAANSDTKSKTPTATPTPTPIAILFLDPLESAAGFEDVVDSAALVLEAVENTRREEVDLAVAMIEGADRVRRALVVLLQQSLPSNPSQHQVSVPQ
jgi:hypothetical protein